jgi:polysaccharide export outer membrane protein
MRVAWVLLLGLAACPDRAVGPNPRSIPVSAADLALGPGDLFDVRVFGEADLSGGYQVDADGTINFPLVGRLVAAGLSPAQLEAQLQTRLADGFIRNPSVSVKVTEYRSKKVTVTGQVRTPGTFAFTEDMSIVEAISRAGGFAPMARKNAVRVTRIVDGKSETVVVAVEDITLGRAPSFQLHPGDVVFVAERIM